MCSAESRVWEETEEASVTQAPHGRPQAPREGSTVPRHSHCLWRQPRSSPETGLSTGRRASQLTQRPQGEGPQKPTRPCRAGPPEPRAAWRARLLRHRGLGHPGPPGDVVSTPVVLIAGDSAEAARTWDLPTPAQTGPWEPRRQVLTSSPPLETPQTVCMSTKLALTFKYLTFLQNENMMLKCDLRPPTAQGQGAWLPSPWVSPDTGTTAATQGRPKAQRSSGVWGQRWPGLC